MKNIKVKYLEEDFRPAFVFDDAKNIKLTDVDIATAKELPVIFLNNTEGVVFKNLKMPVSEVKGILKVNK